MSYDEDEDEDAPPMLVDTTAEGSAEQEPQQPAYRVPITIVTGYLGAGKTTLLNYILTAQHGKKIAVIMNEFGDSMDIEKSLTVSKGGEEVQEWLDVGNGCICCSVKDQGVNAIESLMEKKGAFDYILLETTGLADPGNIAPLFWVDEGLGSTIYLDGIVTLIDAKNILKSLDEPVKETKIDGDEHHGDVMTVAHLQISHADVVVLNKSDLVTEAELEIVKDRVRSINGLAKIFVTHHGEVPSLEGFLLDLHAYDRVDALDIAEKGHSHLDPTISTVTVKVPTLKPNQLPKLDAWLRSILWDSKVLGLDQLQAQRNPKKRMWEEPVAGQLDAGSSSLSEAEEIEVHRLKARVVLSTGEIKIVQGVREVFEIFDGPKGDSVENDTQVEGKIIMIGRNLLGVPFEDTLVHIMSSD